MFDSVAETAIYVGSFDCGSQPRIVASLDRAAADGLPADLRADIALVDAEAVQDDEELLPLLARLRDVNAQKVVVIVPRDHRSLNELNALGFETRKSPSWDGLVFVWDPALADRPREWNNSKHWANPENFSRYRW